MVQHGKGPADREAKPLYFHDHALGATDIARIQALVARHKDATRQELATLVSREFDWRRPNGDLRLRATLDLLVRFHARGLIDLPPSPRRCGGTSAWSQARPDSPIDSPLPAMVRPADVSLREVVVRPILQKEQRAWREAMERFHYLRSARIVGESIRYVAEFEGRWLALLGWGSAAWKSRHREVFLGWDAKTMFRRLHLVANNVRFLILPWVRVPHLASRVLSQNLRRLSRDWEACYDHPILLAETFVDLARFRGICYRAANWTWLGETRGMERKGDGYVAHGRKKAIFVYPLHLRAKEILSAPLPSPEVLRRTPMEVPIIDVNQLPIEGKGSLLELFMEITDPRSRRGIRHPIASVLTLATMAALSGMRSYEAVAEWAADVPKSLLKQLRCWCHQAPSEPTFRRVLQSVNAEEIDKKLGSWLAEFSPRESVALDGKTLKGSRDGDRSACHLLGAITHQSGVVVAQKEVSEKSNEITAAKPLLADLDLKGCTVTADAMHTQRDLARFLVEEKNADYIFIAKDNQKTLREDIQAVNWDSFFPSGRDLRQGARTDGESKNLSER